jgi:hypothetical protein
MMKMTPQQLLELAQETVERWPDGHSVTRNQIGNLAVIRDEDQTYVGYIDFGEPEVVLL